VRKDKIKKVWKGKKLSQNQRRINASEAKK